MLKFVVWALIILCCLMMCAGFVIGVTAKHKDGMRDGLSISFFALIAMYGITTVAGWLGWRP